MIKINDLTKRELEFCKAYVNTGDTEKSAILAGYKNDLYKTGQNLLCSKKIVDKINQLSKLQEKSINNMSAVGYHKLAFGNISDAVSLLYMEQPTKNELKQMDLFLVSEIKRPKDGSMEIKFFDRLKALEKLQNKTDSCDGISNLYNAINNTAMNMESDKAEN